MSAGGISYSGIVNYGKATLPSVEAGLGSMNILRDPPKMIMTRKIDKVGQTSSLTTMIDESGDRAAGSILVYARGVNPFASVDYSNYGNNGGQYVGGFSSSGTPGKQAYLPYRIGSSFRPPVIPQQSLLPLSRQPRVMFSQVTQPEFIDFSKKMTCPQPAEKTKGIKKDREMLKTFVPPTRKFIMELPPVEPFEVKYVIQNRIKVSAHSGTKTLEIPTQTNLQYNTNVIRNDPLHVEGRTNISSRVNKNGNSTFNTGKYIQDAPRGEFNTNPNQNIQNTPIDELYDFSNIKTRNITNIDYIVPEKGFEKQEYIHNDLVRGRTLPEYSIRTNQSQNIHVTPVESIQRTMQLNRPNIVGITNQSGGYTRSDNNFSRDYRLNPTISAGGFEGRGSMPQVYKENNVTLDSQKTTMREKIMDMQMGRNS